MFCSSFLPGSQKTNRQKARCWRPKGGRAPEQQEPGASCDKALVGSRDLTDGPLPAGCMDLSPPNPQQFQGWSFGWSLQHRKGHAGMSSCSLSSWRREVPLYPSSGEHCPRTQLCGGHTSAAPDGYGRPERAVSQGSLEPGGGRQPGQQPGGKKLAIFVRPPSMCASHSPVLNVELKSCQCLPIVPKIKKHIS